MWVIHSHQTSLFILARVNNLHQTCCSACLLPACCFSTERAQAACLYQLPAPVLTLTPAMPVFIYACCYYLPFSQPGQGPVGRQGGDRRQWRDCCVALPVFCCAQTCPSTILTIKYFPSIYMILFYETWHGIHFAIAWHVRLSGQGKCLLLLRRT